MPYYRSVGKIPRKRHTQFRKPDGGLYAEELMGTEGFSSDSALLYHEHLPTAIVDAREWEPPAGRTVPNRPLKPRHFKTHKLDPGSADAVTGRQLLLANDDVRIWYVVADRTSPLYRNAAGDECVYVESGEAVLESVFGALEVGQGDYVIVPTSTTHRWVPRGAAPLRALVVEATGHIAPPRRYLTERGQFNEFAPFCERDLRAPTEPLLVEGEDVDVYVRHRAGGTRFTYAHHPFDVVGWDGCLYPYAFNIADFEPITGRIHQPPPVHQTFAGPNFVICSFVPRKFDYHPLAIPAPYNHANVDSDEVLFYVGGDFMSRKGAGIEIGSISLHPNGFTHGPQPGSVEASIGKEFTEELAVMIDTFRPLDLGEAALACEDTSYAWTWSGRRR
ncbi:homogentisate 1,2-dioxygenase [Carbonactinospora thermoautotrophica]|uniref:Homogentisate 1 n=1 Tax=Carbonactinospora thermoautotrophica TaxID=1469144 RepID=A0A132MWG5_9ACTN|nr:cupin domain-containing protein [Carbonactinospora thermoautotrophica]KWX02209.1 Homogentisate 1 [Carbonactinospora thermoautotrophica]KWX03406.1 homogentisate 1,2-dioxygenase [Carbonactinospora thermoautotrophica]KWX05941.1 homogentisate 1,2-dioxygenase [Carbonactinospora thermoautotrophica]